LQFRLLLTVTREFATVVITIVTLIVVYSLVVYVLTVAVVTNTGINIIDTKIKYNNIKEEIQRKNFFD
jgi:hypothetical protein